MDDGCAVRCRSGGRRMRGPLRWIRSFGCYRTGGGCCSRRRWGRTEMGALIWRLCGGDFCEQGAGFLFCRDAAFELGVFEFFEQLADLGAFGDAHVDEIVAG